MFGGMGYIACSKNFENKRLYQWLSAFLLSINITMSVLLFPLEKSLSYFSNLAVLMTLVNVASIMCASWGQKPGIKQNKVKLALLHILCEVTSAFNIVVVFIYWTRIHFYALRSFTGLKLLHMYLLHTFPVLAQWLAFKTINFYLCKRHIVLLLPFSILYSIYNHESYREMTLQHQGWAPYMQHLTWKDDASIWIICSVNFKLALLWVTIAKLSRRFHFYSRSVSEL